MKKKSLTLKFLLIMFSAFLFVFLSSGYAEENPKKGKGSGKEQAESPDKPEDSPRDAQHKRSMGGLTERLIFMLEKPEVQEKVKMDKKQIEAVESLISDYKKNTIQLNADLELVSVDIQTEMKKDKIDLAKLESLDTKRSESRAKLSKLSTLTLAKSFNLLTKDQKDQIRKFLEEKAGQVKKNFEELKDSKKKK